MSAAAVAAVNPVMEWKSPEVGRWLRSIDTRLEHFIPAFEKANVDGQMLLNEIGDEDLKELIPSPVHRRKVSLALEQLRSPHGLKSPLESPPRVQRGGSGGTGILSPTAVRGGSRMSMRSFACAELTV